MKLYIFLISIFFTSAAYGGNYADREEVKAFVKELAASESFNEKELSSVFAHAQYKQKIIDAISRPAERVLIGHGIRISSRQNEG